MKNWTLKTFVVKEEECPKRDRALEVERGLETGDILNELDNDFLVQFDLKEYTEWLLINMRGTRDAILRDMANVYGRISDQYTTAENAMNAIIDGYNFRVNQWAGSVLSFTQPRRRRFVWEESVRARADFVELAETLERGIATRLERDNEEKTRELEERFVVAFVATEETDRVAAEEGEEEIIDSSQADRTLPREDLYVFPDLANMDIRDDDTIITLHARICLPEDCPPPEPEMQEFIFEYTCLQRVVGGSRDRLPSLVIAWKLPECGNVKIGGYQLTGAPSGIITGETIEFIKGNVTWREIGWAGKNLHGVLHSQSTTACPYPGRTQCFVFGKNYLGDNQADDLRGVFSAQMIIGRIVSITGEGDDRIIRIDTTAQALKPTDWFNYTIGETVIAFAPKTDLKLPLKESDDNLLGDDARVIPIRIGLHGPT